MFNITGTDQIKAKFTRLDRVFTDAGPEIIEPALQAGDAVQKSEAPVRTGYLLSQTGYELTGQYSGVLFSKAPYSVFVNFGTSRMTARPYHTAGAEEVKKQLLAIAHQKVREAIS